MLKKYEQGKIFLTYGSIISFMLNKDKEYSSPIEDIGEGCMKINNQTENESKQEKDIFLTSEFLYSQGVFNEYSFFHIFKEMINLKHDYYNSLFLVLPKGEYDSFTKLRALKRQLKNEYIIDDYNDLDRQQINDTFLKFKQEIYTNQKYSIKLLTSKKNYVNFDDCVQFMHIKSGKFLEYNQDPETLKIYICLTETPSERTTFRFVPAFNYQGVNSTRVMNNLVLKIACGGNIISGSNEKFICKREHMNLNNVINEEQKNNIKNLNRSQRNFMIFRQLLLNIIPKAEENKRMTFGRARNARDSLQILVNENQSIENIKNNFKTYLNISSIPYKGFGKKIIPDDVHSVSAGNMKNNFWKLFIFSKNFFEDNKYINSLDIFCIQNNEKNLFIQAINCQNKFKEKRKFSIFNNMNRMPEDENSLKSINNNIRNTNSFWGRVSSLSKKTVKPTIKLDYFYDNDFGSDIDYDLIVNQYEEEEENLEPFGLFKFEFVYNYGEYGVYEQNRNHKIDILKDQGHVRLINIFTNKVLMADMQITPIGNIFKLKLVNDAELVKKRKEFYKTIFVIEKVKDLEDLFIEEEEDENQENNKVNNENVKKKKTKKGSINKNDYIKIRSKKYNFYLGIRLNNDTNKRSLVLTNTKSDLTKFKLNFLDDIDKYELHFFEQLLRSFKNIINYFINEDVEISDKSIEFNLYSFYVKIEHILINLEKRINNFPENNKVKISQKNKFDFKKVIEHFNIVSKLIDIFLANWFHKVQNLDYFDCEKILENYFKNYEEKEELTILRCKTIISKEIFKILKTIYDLEKSYLNVIEDRLLYFLMFIGRDDKCTKFLIYLLNNNGDLIISLCPMFNKGLNNQYNRFSSNSINSGNNISNNINNTINTNNIIVNSINNSDQPNKFTYIKHCLKRIMKTYNSMDFVKFKIDFSSVILLFNVLNCLLLYYQKPFLQFYDEYFKDLEILRTRNYETFPNYEQNSIIVHFVLKNDKIFVKKKKFFVKIGDGSEEELYEPLRNYSSRNDEFEFDLSELIDIINENDVNNNYSAIILAKLVAINLIFYSHLSLCNQDFKLYLQKIFDFNIVMNNYLNNNLSEFDINTGQNKKFNEYDITNDIKYSLTKLMIFLYFRISFPFSGKMDLFYCLEEENINNIFSNLNSSIVRTEKPDRIDENMLNGINNYICNLLLNISQLKDSIQNYPFFVFEVLESAKYVIRNLFVFKNDRDKIDKSINLMSLVLLLLEKFFGYSVAKDILGRTKDSGDIFNTVYKDDESLDKNYYLLTDNSKLIFEKYRKKLKNITKSKENITKKRLFKIILLILSSQKNEKKYFLNIKDTERRQKAFEQLNKYQLSRILMEISTKGNVYEDNITENILLLICDIFLEFIKYIENLEIDHIFNQINKFNRQRQNIQENQSEDEYFDFLINSIIKYNNGEGEENFNYFEELKNKFLINLNEEKDNIDKENIFSIFKFLKIIDKEEFRYKILEILYRQNSQKKIFYENITNIVLFETQNQFNKFLRLKEIFLKLFNSVQNMNLIKRLDNNSYALFNKLEEQFNILVKQLFDERKWRKDNDLFITKGSSNFDNEEEIAEVKKDNKGFSRKKSIFNEILPDNNNNINDYFISEFTTEDIFNAQQTLYNLGFIDLINQIFEYISWVVDIKDELKEELASLEKILISIYKLLSIFIFNNKKHQFIIREKLFLYIQPLKLNIKSLDILAFIGYFLLNVAYFFETKEDFNQIQHLDEVITSINNLKNLDWAKNKKIIKFYFHSLKKFISFCSYEHFTLIYPVLEIINSTLVREILNNTDTKEDIEYIIKILSLIKEEQHKKTNDLKTTPIISLHEIINAFFDMMNLIKENNLKKYLKLFQIFVIVTNIFCEHFDLYKNEFLLNRIYRRNLVKTLTTFCNSFNLTDETIYCSKTKYNTNLKKLNEFIGISLPKLYILLSSLGMSGSASDDSLSCLIYLANELYEIILIMNENDENENSFLNKSMETDITNILENIGSELAYLSIVQKKILPNLDKQKPDHKRSLKNKKDLIEKLNIKDNLRKETFSFIWNKIRHKINNMEGLNNFQNFVKYEINQERMNYVKNMMNFFDNLLLTNYSLNIGDENLEKNKINESIMSYFETYIESIKESFSKDLINYKNEIYFFFWTNIHMMRYNRDTKKFISNENLFDSKKINLEEKIQENQDFEENNKKKINYFNYSITPYNKRFFHNSNFIEMTIKQFNSNNINSKDYGYLLYIKFLNSYLDNLENAELEDFFEFFITQEEVENIFSFMKIVLDSLDKEINDNFQKDEIKKINDKEKSEENKYSSNLFENDIEKYELIIQFITKLSADNSGMEQTMKNYLRIQENNSKSFNFIDILSKILVNFTKDNSNRVYINKYYSIIIQIIDCLSKCCNGPCEKNQDCIVNETNLLDFIRNIIKTITYRPKIWSDSGLGLMPCYDRNHVEEMSEIREDNTNILNVGKPKEDIVDECANVGLNRYKLSFLKYKLLYFLSILTIGRKKDESIFENIHKVIDFDVLACVLIETYKEILIEKESQRHCENLVFGEDMLQRMDKGMDYNCDNNENFIIFEIGTYTFILINIYSDNLTLITDDQILKTIKELNKELKEKKYYVKKKSIFDSVTSFGRSVYRCFKALCIKCGNCLTVNIPEDFYLANSFYYAYSFYYDYTPNIEVMAGGQIMKYYVKLSPICKCLTEEMKEDFHSKADRSSTKAKIEYLFGNVDYYHFILVHAKKRLDLFRTIPILDLFFNHYKFYRDVFMIIGALQNVLLFCSLYRTNDDYMEVTEYSPDFEYDYGFLYKHKNITITRNIFFATTLIQCILACLILLTYIFTNIPRLSFFEIPENELKNYYSNDNQKVKFTTIEENYQEGDFFLLDYEKKRKNVKLYQKVFSFLYNLIQDGMLFYHLLMFAICLVTVITQNYRFLAFLLTEIIIHSSTLKNIVKSFWVPRKPLIMTLILFYLIAYYFIIFVYLFLPHQLPTKDCFVFSDCFFTLCDQTIKNSNGIINYLVEEGLYITKTLYENPRFWIDNWFAIIDIMLVLQMACSIITNSYIALRDEQRKLEKDQNNKCFICGISKNDLNKIYSHEEGFYEHIKLDHYLWNYIFSIFSIVKKNPKNLMSADKNIFENYKKGMYSAWVPHKKCRRQIENKNEGEIIEENESEDSDKEDDNY